MFDLFNWGVNSITEYGIMTVISGLFIYLFYQDHKAQKRITKDLIDANKEITKHLLGIKEQYDDMCNKMNKTSIDKVLHNSNLNLRMKITNGINKKLIEVIYSLGLKRAAIFEFHNTNENFSGFPFAKYTCNFEMVKKGVLPVLNQFSALLFSSISFIISLFDEHGIYVMKGLNTLEQNSPTLSHIFELNNMNNIIFVGMYDINNNVYGFIAYEFDDDLEVTDELKYEVLQYSQVFSTTLDLKNNNFEL